ncbi:MAG: AAA family ATPase, partial [Thermoleophilia bacterium]|nr:AAA family ATPase [Thermoleophilia bacterium]
MIVNAGAPRLNTDEGRADGGGDEGADRDPGQVLRPYVPLLVIDWLRFTPAAAHRELEASLVFVDISGFTALTERLSKQGKIGAEMMRDTLDGVFRALLDEAYDWGAGLLKWGGDALLLLFQGPGHEERSCRAAWEMQRTIDRVGRLSVPGGRVTLRMSVGIGTGMFHFFMVGSVHRELLIAGPAMSETLEIEGIADAGEIGISATLAAAIDPACVGEQKELAFLLAKPPETTKGRAPDVGNVAGLDIPSCIPVAARAHVLLEKSEPEHRTITAAFIDMMDTDRLLAELGPEGLAAGLDERMCTIQEAALRHEVPFYESDVGKSSVKALLTAGAPSSTGQDEERMLRALREIMDQSGAVPMRIGVNTGKVFTGDFGPPYRRAYRVFGDAINTAARVMSKAEAGQILSTQIVLDRSRTMFETAPIQPFAAKGKAELVRASIVGPIIGVKEQQHRGMPLMGRDSELRAVLDAVDEARHGSGWIVEIAGQPGLGKTRFVEEVIARSPDVRVLHSRGEEYESSTPYFGMRAVLRDVLRLSIEAHTDAVTDRLREVVAEVDASLLAWLPLLALLLGIDLPQTPETKALDQRFLRDKLSEVAMQFLGAALAGSPTMLVVEDVHHMDEATRDLLLRLSAAGLDKRQVLLVTHTDTEAVFAPVDDDNLKSVVLCLLPLPITVVGGGGGPPRAAPPPPPPPRGGIARRGGGAAVFVLGLIDARG